MRKLTAIVSILAVLALGASPASARGAHHVVGGGGHGGGARVATFSGSGARIAAPRFASQSRVASSAAFQGNGRAHHRHHRHHPAFFVGAGYPTYYYDNYDDDDDIVCYYSRKYERRVCRPA